MREVVEIVGRLAGDPTMRYTDSGVEVTNFTVVTSVSIPKKDKECPAGWKESYNGKRWEKVKFWRVTAWRGLAESCNEFLQKGRMVLVEGTLKGSVENGIERPRIWETNDGESVADFELDARQVVFLGGGGDREDEVEEPEAPAPQTIRPF